jgi:biopolymer transport protein ExbD
MAGQVEPEDDDIIAGINITPMVDIILVLLIIFMVTTSVIMDDSIKVDLPEASSGDETKISILGLVIDPQGLWHLNGQATSEAELRGFIQGAKGQGEELQAIIAADRGIPHGDVIHLIDVVKQEGVRKFALNIEHPPDAAGAVTPVAVPGTAAPGGAAGAAGAAVR